MKKTTTKKISNKKYSYIVNLNDIQYLDDIRPVFALAKQDAGLPLTDDELMSIVEYFYEAVGPKVTCMICEEKKEKKPWYKRFWNWIRRK